jgi:23S rRNA pseudouridine2605 synthase
LQKILAQAGIASRRHAEELITQGRVQVNGQVVTTLGSKADPTRDHVRVDGKLLQGAERLRYFVLNKPRGYVTTVSDPEGRPTVMEFFAKLNERLYPVGRLDYLSEGLLLVTNDGELANKLTRAASGVEKTYLVKVSGQPTEQEILTLTEGVRIDRGRPGEGSVRTAPARIREIRAGDNPWFEVVLIEGRNRELRKMFEEIGHFVEKIRRVGYGPLILDLEPGQHRELDPEELRLLRLAAEGKWKPKRLKTADLLPKEAGRTVDYEAGKRGKKPFRAQPSRPGTGDRRESRGGAVRPGQSGGERRPFQGAPRGGERRPEWKPSRPPGERGRFGPPAERAGGRQERSEPGSRDFARPRPPQGGGFTRPGGAGEQRRPDSRRPGPPSQGADRGQGRDFNRGFVKPGRERAGFSRSDDRRGPPPPRIGERAGERDQISRGPARGPAYGQDRGQGRDQGRGQGFRPAFRPASGPPSRPGFGPPRGERRDFARPPREDSRSGGKPASRPSAPRGERPSVTRGGERPSGEGRPPRPAGTGARPPRSGGPDRRSFGRPSGPGSRPASGPRSSSGPRSGSGPRSASGPRSGSGPRSSSRPGSGSRPSNRGGAPKRRP